MTELRKCSRCKLEKEIFQFGTRSRKMQNGTKKVYTSIYCKKCVSIEMKIWRAANPEKVKEQNASSNHRKATNNWMEDHQEERQVYEQQYHKDHPEVQKRYRQSPKGKETKRQYKRKNRANINKQEQKRRLTDINFHLKKNISSAIRSVIKKKGQSTFKYLPYTPQELREHLESQFDEKMTWHNYGTYWHLDHIKPHSLFKYKSMNDEAFKQCWALTNLRPLEAKQNMSDGATRIRHKQYEVK